MTEEPSRGYTCPTCEKFVDDDENYIVADEYEAVAGFGAPTDLAAGLPRRFHRHHFQERIGDRIYRLSDLETWP
jgi:hypothetical protein